MLLVSLQFGDALLAVLDRLKLAASAVGERQHFLDPVAILSLKTMDKRQPILNLAQPARVKLDPVPVLSQRAGQILQLIAQALGRLAQSLGRRIEPGQSGQGAHRRLQLVQCRLALFAALVDRYLRLVCQLPQLLGIGQPRALLR